MKTRFLYQSLAALSALSLSLTGCSKKSEPVNPPAAPAPAPVAAAPDPAKAIADAAQAKIDAAKRESAVVQAQADAAAAIAKAQAAELQAQAEQKAAEAKRAAADLKTQATSAKNSLLSSANAFAAEASATSTPSTTASSTPAASASSTSLQTLSQNLNPANFSAWYEQASKESSGIISSLATKAAELGSSASPQFKSLYDTALAQKKTFDDVSNQLKTGGLTQWASLYPKLQTSWTDLSKSLTDAKALLAQYSK